MMKFCNILSQSVRDITRKETSNWMLTLLMPSSCSCISSARPTIYCTLLKKKRYYKFRYTMNILALISLENHNKKHKNYCPMQINSHWHIEQHTLHVQVRIKLHKKTHAGTTAIRGVTFCEYKRPFTRS